ncbi:hypothetical protein GCM10010104_35310 [Streptomyces indiaensis]|uniref:Uncharacterized protein n=1 Tax=Streptomyces indiaensis TaxID=284033 RepID=A0ABN3DNH2_9ACTN
MFCSWCAARWPWPGASTGGAVGLLLCQLVTGVMQALGVVAIVGTLTALLRDGDGSAGQSPPIGRSRPLGRAVTVRAWTS